MTQFVPTQLAPRDALTRTRETPSQVGRDADARRDNVRGAFRADAQVFSGATLLLLDDVMTSGATLQACAEAARTAGARHVLALTLSGRRLTTHKEP
jgi:competence protein ComFC